MRQLFNFNPKKKENRKMKNQSPSQSILFCLSGAELGTASIAGRGVHGSRIRRLQVLGAGLRLSVQIVQNTNELLLMMCAQFDHKLLQWGLRLMVRMYFYCLC